MIDLWYALRGRKHCPWCIERPDSPIEKWINKCLYRDAPRYKKIVWWTWNHGGLNSWRLGWFWHRKVHVHE